MARAWLTPVLANALLAAMRDGSSEQECSLDLGLSRRRVRLSRSAATLPDGTEVAAAQLREVAAAKRGVFLAEPGRCRPIQTSADYFYKLIPTDEAPTIEISGIQMHRTTGTVPFRNALESARTVVRKGTSVLDTCGGLGYTAIAAARLGAASVVSVEVDSNVLAIARQNPWSAEYFTNPVISVVNADVCEFIASQPDEGFDRAIHDPPRFSRAGELYGSEFYGQLARVLRPRGQLFHYTGEPYSRGRGRSFVLGVVRRLQGAGFSVKRSESLQGLVAGRK